MAACYWAKGNDYRIDTSVALPCGDGVGFSSCCFLGDTCLEGSACYNEGSGNTYQLGCSDESYQDDSCPYKCGYNPDASPWVALAWCDSYGGINNTWYCQSPENCQCTWRATFEMLILPPLTCQALGSEARVAVYNSPLYNDLPAYLQLPSTPGGATGYFEPGATTPVTTYTPSSIGPTGTLRLENSIKQYVKHQTATDVTFGIIHNTLGSIPPIPSTPTTAPSSDVLGGASTSGSAKTSSGSRSGSPTSTGTQGSHTITGSGSNNGNGGSGSGSGLTTGAKVGLGVGIAGGICLIAAIILVAMIFRRRKRREIEAATIYKDKSEESAAYYDPYGRGANVHEAQYTSQEEATARKYNSPNGIIAELDSGQPIHELESTNNTTVNTPLVGHDTAHES